MKRMGKGGGSGSMRKGKGKGSVKTTMASPFGGKVARAGKKRGR